MTEFLDLEDLLAAGGGRRLPCFTLDVAEGHLNVDKISEGLRLWEVAASI